MMLFLLASLAVSLSGKDSSHAASHGTVSVTAPVSHASAPATAAGTVDASRGVDIAALYRAALINAPAPRAADSIVVQKAAHTLILFSHGVPVKAYLVALGKNPVGDKQRIGDGRTPEGTYHIDVRNAGSKYHLALHISYPDAAHMARAAAMHVSPGGDVMIHGLPDKYAQVGAAHRLDDWTEGCIAVTDQEIEQIFAVTKVGTPITIEP